MPRQTSRLCFRDRIAELPQGGFLFRCQRAGHGETILEAPRRRAVEDARTDHDHAYHRGRGVPQGALSLGQVVGDFQAYYGKLEILGKRDAKTTRYYRDIGARILEHLDKGLMAASVNKAMIRGYVLSRLAGGTTGGARIEKEIKGLFKMMRHAGLEPGWHPRDFGDDIGAQRRPRPALTSSQVVGWIKAMDQDARDFAIVKLRTVMRNVELYDLRVKDIDFKAGLIRFIKRAKRKKAPAVQVIAPDVEQILKRRIKGKGPEDFVFTVMWRGEARKAGESSFRKACIRASKAEKISPPITSLGIIRHHALTAIRAALGIDDAAASAGHSTVRVIEQHYDLDRDKLEAKRRAGEANQRAFPMG
jgi:integrase